MTDYRLTLRVVGQKGLEPSWLVGAIRNTYAKAEVVSVQPVGADLVDAVVRFKQEVPDMAQGDVVAPILQGIDWAPGLVTPSAVLENATALTSTRSLEMPTGVELSDLGRLGLALLMIGTTAYLVHRRARHKHGGAGHAHARSA